MFVPRKIVEDRLKQILAEDVGQGDVTAAAIIPTGLTVQAEVIAKEAGIVAGIEEATILAESLGLTVKAQVADGQEIKNKQTLMQLTGDAQTILAVERTLLNLLSRMRHRNSHKQTNTKTKKSKLQSQNRRHTQISTRHALF
jgi:nicotinate-nucleotide pyrophosphorylase (carboxylating)